MCRGVSVSDRPAMCEIVVLFANKRRAHGCLLCLCMRAATPSTTSRSGECPDTSVDKNNIVVLASTTDVYSGVSVSDKIPARTCIE